MAGRWSVILGKDARIARLAPLASEETIWGINPGRRLLGAALPGAIIGGPSGAMQMPRFAREYGLFKSIYDGCYRATLGSAA